MTPADTNDTVATRAALLDDAVTRAEVRRLVDGAPPLTPEQIRRLRDSGMTSVITVVTP